MKPQIVYANILGRTMRCEVVPNKETPGSSGAANCLGGEANVEAFLNKRPPCECGNANAGWHGDRCGHRYYACDDCAQKIKATHGADL